MNFHLFSLLIEIMKELILLLDIKNMSNAFLFADLAMIRTNNREFATHLAIYRENI